MSPQRKIGLYLAITFVVSWGVGLGFAATGQDWGSPASQAVAMLFMMPPAFAALIVKGAMAHDPLLEELGLKLRVSPWWLFSWLLPPLILGLTWCMGALMPGVETALSLDDFLAYYRDSIPADQMESFEAQVRSYGMHPVAGMLMQAMMAGVTINAIRGLGEELGWRGLLHHELKLGFWRKSLVTGLLWGIWYAPLVAQGYRFAEHPMMGVPMTILWCLLAAPIFEYVRVRSRSILATGILYGTLEGMSKIPPLLTGGNDLTIGLYGISGLMALALVLAAIWFFDQKLSKSPSMLSVSNSPA